MHKKIITYPPTRILADRTTAEANFKFILKNLPLEDLAVFFREFFKNKNNILWTSRLRYVLENKIDRWKKTQGTLTSAQSLEIASLFFSIGKNETAIDYLLEMDTPVTDDETTLKIIQLLGQMKEWRLAYEDLEAFFAQSEDEPALCLSGLETAIALMKETKKSISLKNHDASPIGFDSPMLNSEYYHKLELTTNQGLELMKLKTRIQDMLHELFIKTNDMFLKAEIALLSASIGDHSLPLETVLHRIEHYATMDTTVHDPYAFSSIAKANLAKYTARRGGYLESMRKVR